uniref:Uncharacterized protein n=1 Tax=Populus alba TaxID=43335 RepID=A0A4U5QUD2_POPAL|nr:hypothetical protein D5086_0000047570 [Populus alba]
MQFLMGLNDSYNAVRGQILLMKELPSVREVYSLIIQEEKQREIGSPVIEGVSIAAAVKTQKRAGSSHHRSGNQTSFRGTPTSYERTLHCTYCNQDHHTIDHCYKLHGYPPGHKLYHGGSNPSGHSNARSASHNESRNKWRTSSSYAHQVQAKPTTAATQTEQSSSHVDRSTQNLKNILDGLSVDQCKQLAAAMVHFSKPTSENTDVFANAAGLPNSPSVNSILSHSWILDSGATDHISSDPTLFIHSNTSRMSCVNLPTVLPLPLDPPHPDPFPISSHSNPLPSSEPNTRSNTHYPHGSSSFDLTPSSPSSLAPALVPTRQSTRQKRPPSWQQYYHLSNATISPHFSSAPTPSPSAESCLTGIRPPLLGSPHAPRKRDAEKNNFRIKFHRSGYTKFCLKNIIYLKLAD